MHRPSPCCSPHVSDYEDEENTADETSHGKQQSAGGIVSLCVDERKKFINQTFQYFCFKRTILNIILPCDDTRRNVPVRVLVVEAEAMLLLLQQRQYFVSRWRSFHLVCSSSSLLHAASNERNHKGWRGVRHCVKTNTYKMYRALRLRALTHCT